MALRFWLRKRFPAYLFAFAGVILAASIRYELGPSLGGTIPVVLFTVPITFAALYGGWGPGVFCTLVSALISNFLFIEPYFSLKAGTQAIVVAVTLIVIGLTISYVGQRMKSLQLRLQRQTRKIEQANRELERADTRKDEFLAMLAHELRNPLAGIGTAAEMLKLIRIDQDRTAQTGEMIARQVRHMTKLVDDLLDVSRVTRGLAVIDKQPVDMRDAVQGALEQIQPALTAKRQQLTVQLPEEPACVCGDRTRLTQVVSNLLANANRYSPVNARIRIDLRVSGGLVEIAVEDNGQGIDPALQPRIFDLFVQAERSIDRSEGGLGIGLALVQKIAELHDGEVSVFSAGRGQGSRFAMTLPALAREPVEQARSAAPASKRAASASTRVLVVDDNRDAADSLGLLLEVYGFAVVVENAARVALERARGVAFDAVILDIGLPDIDGRALCREMKTIPHLADSVFVAVSGYGTQADRSLSADAGFDHHFAKPVLMEELIRVLASKKLAPA